MDLSLFIKLILLLAVSIVFLLIQNYFLKIYEKECLKFWNKSKDGQPVSGWLKLERFVFAFAAVLLIAGLSAVLGYYCGTQNFFSGDIG